MGDELLRPALEKFFSMRSSERKDALLVAVRQPVRDTMREARIAGQVEAYEHCLSELHEFAKQQLTEATANG